MAIFRMLALAILSCYSLFGSTILLAGAEPADEAPAPIGEQSVLIAPEPDASESAAEPAPINEETVTQPPLILIAPRSTLLPPPPIAERKVLEELPAPAAREVAPPPTEVAPLSPPKFAPVERPITQLGVLPGTFVVVVGAPPYPFVRVKDRHKVAPGAIPSLVAVRDPHACSGSCTCCTRRCVFVEVWRPPYPPKKLKVKDNGREIKLDYGEYEVEIESKKRGFIEVDYDD